MAACRRLYADRRPAGCSGWHGGRVDCVMFLPSDYLLSSCLCAPPVEKSVVALAALFYDDCWPLFSMIHI